MPYRVRPINWNLLLQPSMAGIDIKAQASNRFAQTILGAGEAIGSGIVRGRQEAESRRRFDANQADELRREGTANAKDARDFAFREKVHADEMLEKARQRQADDATLLDLTTGLSEQAQVDYSLTGAVKPETSMALKQASDALGGPEATQERLALRGAKECADGTCRLPSDGGSKTDFQRDVPMFAGDDQAREDLGYRPDGSRQPRWNEGGGMSLKDKPPALAPSMELRPPAPPPPTVGENGIPNAPSDAKYAEAAKIDATVKALAQQKARIERELDSSKGVSASVRAKARLAISNLDTQITALSERGGAAKRQADQAKMAEDKARADADRKRQEAEKAVEKSKDQIHDLVAWGGGAERQRYMKADVSREDVRAEIDIAHTREKEKHTAAAHAREAKKFTPEYRNSLESFVEADPESTITDARSLSDDELHKEYNLSRKRDEAAARQANIDKDDKRADETMKLRESEAKRRTDYARLKTLEARVAKWDDGTDNGANFKPGTPAHEAYWEAKGEIDEIKRRLEGGGSGPVEAPALTEKPWANDPLYLKLSAADKARWDAERAAGR